MTADCVIFGGGISGLFIAQALATNHSYAKLWRSQLFYPMLTMVALVKAKGPNSWFLQERTHGRHPEAISARLGNKVKVSWKLKSEGYNSTYETPEGICTEQNCSNDCPISFASLLHPLSNFPMMSDLMKLLKLCHLSSGHDGIFLGGNYVAAGVALGQCVEGTYKTAIPSQ